MTVRVLLVDDQALVRAGIRRIFDADPEIVIVGECSDGDEVMAAVLELRPDVVVMDVRMKRVSGPAATSELQALETPPPVLALTTFDDDATVAAALGAGAAGFVLKDAPGEELIRAARAVAVGDAWIDPQVAARVVAAYREFALPSEREAVMLQQLTSREHDVLRLMAEGRTNDEVASELSIGAGTVKTHVRHVFTKLGVRDRSAAIIYAFRHGVVSPHDGNSPPPPVSIRRST